MATSHVVVIVTDPKSETSGKEENQGSNERRSISNVVRHVKSLSKQDMRKLTHSVKVGIALVLVSLLYLIDPLYDQVGENAMWAIMTVVVMFEFYAGLLPQKISVPQSISNGIFTLLNQSFAPNKLFYFYFKYSIVLHHEKYGAMSNQPNQMDE